MEAYLNLVKEFFKNDYNQILVMAIFVLLVLFWNFTTVESGNVKFVNVGETFWRKLEPGKGIFAWIGLHWIGIRYIHKIHVFEIQRDTKNPLGKKPDDWVKHESRLPVTELRNKITRPYVLENVELGDRSKMDVLVFYVIEEVEGEKFVYDLKANFAFIDSTISGFVADEIKEINNIAEFIAKDKSEGPAGFLNVLKGSSACNDILKERSGYRLVNISISDYNADEAMLNAANQEALKKLEALALIADAQGKADALEITSTAQAKAKALLVAAEISTYIEEIKKSGADKKTIAISLASILRSKSIEVTQLNTLVEGGGNAIISTNSSQP